MSRTVLMSAFEDEHDLLEATSSARKQGLKIVDVFAPYAVHGLDRAMGLERSRLPVVCFFLGLFGAAFKVWFEFWTNTVDWPVNVGGKPWDSLPAYVPVTFEVMVLFAGVSTVIAFLFVARLLPGRKARLPQPAVTDNRFVLVLEETDAAFDAERVKKMLAAHRAVDFEERVEEA